MGACTCKAARGGAQPQPLFRETPDKGAGVAAFMDDLDIKQPLASTCAGDDSTSPSETDLNDGSMINLDESTPKSNSGKELAKAPKTSCMSGLLRPWCCS
mmetsp:Transcript_9823/g.19007  ORF Transcript_9823/g.19007 Transcript_9823/m.19007 type:complete len:100 (+) Transcript_9823:51-350(+)